MTYSTTTRSGVLKDLEAVNAARGTVPRALVLDLADDVGCSPSTIWGWWRNHRDGALREAVARRDGMPEPVMEVLYATGGNVSRAHRELLKDPDTAALTHRAARWRTGGARSTRRSVPTPPTARSG